MKKVAVLLSFCFLFGAFFSPSVSAVAYEIYTDTFIDSSGLVSNFADKTIVCLGDSITVGSQDSGAGFPPASGGYPGRLNQTLLMQNYSGKIVNSGLSSDTLIHCRPLRASRVDVYNPDYLFILFGTNDFRFTYAGGVGSNPVTVSQFEENYTLFIQEIQLNNPGVVIALGTIPPIVDYRQGTFYNQTLFNTAIQNVSTLYSLDLIDIHEHFYNHGNISWVGVDDIHPNPVGYHWIAQALYDLWFRDNGMGFSTGSGLIQNSTGIKNSKSYCPYYDDHYTYTGVVTKAISTNMFADTRARLDSGVGQTATLNMTATDYITVYYSKSATGGIMSVTWKGTLLGSIDTYNAASLYKQSTTYAGQEGVGDLVLEITGKNGASGGYYISLESVVTNYSKSEAYAISTAYTATTISSPDYIISYSATSRNEITRIMSLEEENTLIECSRNATLEPREEAFGGYLGRIGIFGPSDPELADQDTMSTILLGFGTARFYFAESTATGWLECYLDGVKQFDVNVTGTAVLTWANIVNVSLGSYGVHNVTFVKGTNSTAMFPLCVEYHAFDINFFTSEDGSNWTFTNDTSVSDSGSTVYFKFLFFGDECTGPSADITSVTITFYGDSTTVVMFGELTNTLMGYIPLVIVLGIIFTFMVKFGIAKERRNN